MAWRSFRSLVVGAALVTAVSGGGGGGRNPATPPTPAVASPAPLASAESRAARAKLDAYKAELDQKEAALQRQRLTGAELQTLRQEIDPVAEGIRAIVDDFGPRVEGAKARLDQLGPKPEEAPPESPDVARERTAREAALADLGETQRLAKTLLVQAEQLTTQISDRRRGVFAIGALPAAAGSWVVYAALEAVGFLPPRIQPFAASVLSGLAFVAFVKALADALLADGHASWRVIAVSDAAAARTAHFAIGLSAVYAVGKALEALNTGIAAALPISV